MGFEICAIQNNIVTQRTGLCTLYRFQSPYTVLYCTVLHCTIQYLARLHTGLMTGVAGLSTAHTAHTEIYTTVQNHTIQYNTLQYSTVHSCTIKYSTGTSPG